jgi:hypothetical protein
VEVCKRGQQILPVFACDYIETVSRKIHVLTWG